MITLNNRLGLYLTAAYVFQMIAYSCAILRARIYKYIYIYIYVRVCVCVCVIVSWKVMNIPVF